MNDLKRFKPFKNKRRSYKPILGTLIVLIVLSNVMGVTASQIGSCGNITSPGVYNLNQSLSSHSTCIVISASDVVFDGNGHSITCSDRSFGVYVHNPSKTLENVTVKDLTVSGCYYGIVYHDASAGIIQNNDALDNRYGTA